MSEDTTGITPAHVDGATLYTPKNILITGGAGFIGSHMVVHLVQSYPEYRVVNFDKLDYCSSLQNLSALENYPNYRFIKGNICSADFLSFVLRVEEIDTIMHFAAQSHVDNSFGNSLQFSENNILGTHQLLEAARTYGKVRRFIHVSTDEVYGSTEHDTEGFEHSSMLQPTNPYAATKAGAEFLVQAYHKSFIMPTIITRSNNVYGPHQYPEKIIPKFILLLQRGKPCPVHGDGSERRNYLYVSDVVRAYDTILHRALVGGTYNIGTPFSISNLEVAKDLIHILGIPKDKEADMIQFVENRPFNDQRYNVNSDKLAQLGWQPRVEWAEGLRLTMAWYSARGSTHWPDPIDSALVPHPRGGDQLASSDHSKPSHPCTY